MINFALLYLGKTWTPEWLETCYSGDGFERELEDTLQTPWRFTTSQLSVANTVGSSVRTLQRLLDNSGESFRQIVDRVRLYKAKALLIETDTPVTEIAHSLGYSDSANFTRAFRRWTGKPPAALRI